MTGYGLGHWDQEFESQQSQAFFTSPYQRDWLWGPSSLLNGRQGVEPTTHLRLPWSRKQVYIHLDCIVINWLHTGRT
jgi:hypothetical protein